jgi:hypothetical protein
MAPTRFTTLIRKASLLVLASVALNSKSGAQSNAESNALAEVSRRVAVTIGLVDELAYPRADAVILRRHVTIPHDVILMVRDRLQNTTLEEATLTLLSARALTGDTATTDMVIRVQPVSNQTDLDRRHWNGREHARAMAIIQRLKKSTPVDVDGVGTIQAVVIYLPPKAMNGSLRKQPKGELDR